MNLLNKNPKTFYKLIRNYSKINEGYAEVRIPVPWGHIAGKWWGSKEKRPILVLHGYQDNCGSFDRLLPGLTQQCSFLAIDSPGHGYSSYIPKGMFYNFLNGPLLIRQIMEYFKWPKVSLMGHSMGAMTSFAFATYLQNSIDLLICIDGLFPIVLPNYTERNGKLIERYMKYSNLNERLTEPPSYTLEELVKKVYEGTRKSVDIDKAEYILKRNTLPSAKNPGKYYFSMDQRLKAGPHFIGVPEMFFDDINRILCPIFVAIPEGSPFFGNQTYFEKYLKILGDKPNTEIHMVEGTHHAHLNEPDNIRELISKFLGKYDTFDRTVEEETINISKKVCSST